MIFLPATGDAEVPVTQAQAEEWARLYPAVDVAQALRNMRGWLQANPSGAKPPGPAALCGGLAGPGAEPGRDPGAGARSRGRPPGNPQPLCPAIQGGARPWTGMKR